MDECMYPEVDAVFTIPCDEFIDCSTIELPRSALARLRQKAAGLAASSFAGLPPDRLVEQLRLWVVQGEYVRAVTGTPKSTQNSSEDLPLFNAWIAAFNARTEPTSPSGVRLSAAERTELLAMPRPAHFTLAEWTAMTDRMDALQAGPLPPDVAAAKANQDALVTELLARGWRTTVDGMRQGFVRRSRVAAPARASDLFPARAHFYRLLNLDSGFEQRGRLNAQGRFDGLILAPDSLYLVSYFDPLTKNAGAAVFLSRAAGRTTPVLTAPLEPLSADELDSDGDQLADLVEVIIGTATNRADTDGDGVQDGAEIAAGTNPADGQALGLGVVVRRDTPGTAIEIDTVNDRAIVADSDWGLAVFDVANSLAPVLLSQFKPASGRFEAVATAGEFVVAVPGATTASAARVHIFYLTSDGELSATGNVAVGAVPDAVVAAGLYAYAPGRSANAPTLAVIRLSDALLMRHISITGSDPVTTLALDGDVLWALTRARLLSFRISNDNQLSPLGELPVSGLTVSPLEPGLELTAASSRVYVGHFQGFHIIDGSNPASPVLLHAPPRTQAAVHDVALTGSGLMLPVTSFGGEGTLALSAYDVRDDRSTNFVTSFETPGTTRAVALHRGYALVADGNAGLAVVNFLSADQGTNPPTITLRPFVSHPPNGQEADQAFFVSTVTSDDTQVRDVEFYVDGALAARCGKFPFAVTLRAPALTATKSSFVLRAKATDTGGNSAWSSEVTLSLLPDLTPPRLVVTSPAHNDTPARGSISALSAVFDSVVSLGSLQSGWSLTAAGADGNFGSADDVPISGGDITFDPVERIAIRQFNAPLLSGRYRMRFAASVSDLGGNMLGTDETRDFTIPTAQPTSATPANGWVALTGTLRRFEVRFDERLTASSVTPASLVALRTTTLPGVAEAGGAASISADARGAVLEFPQPLADGGYRVIITPEIRDVYGAPVETNFPVTVTVKGPAVWIQDASGLWQTGTNWNMGTAPLAGDHVVIDRPGATPTVTQRTAATVTTLRSEEPFVLEGNRLTVIDNALFNGPFSWMNGATFLGGVIEWRGVVVAVGTQNKFLDNAVLRNVNMFEWRQGGILLRNSAVFHNLPGAVFLINKAGPPADHSGFVGSSLLHNEGTLRKGGGAELSFFDGLNLLNTGLIEVRQGVLELSTTTTNAGVMQVEAGTRLILGTPIGSRGGSFDQVAPGRISGDGEVVLGARSTIAGTFDFNGLTTISGA
ncbi:MAG: hypothetical protein L0Z50_17945, partial [Verrucomicrobiales bacterium]|nr:hypothetical protein [Verrucomicrobiales bacterium]